MPIVEVEAARLDSGREINCDRQSVTIGWPKNLRPAVHFPGDLLGDLCGTRGFSYRQLEVPLVVE
jgi:hypothetical protein